MMPLPPALGIAVVLASVAGVFGVVKLLEWLIHPHPELLRKLVHVGTGLIVISLPWVFDEQWPVLLLAGLSAASMLCVKCVPRLRDGIGTVVNNVRRPTFGELCVPISVAALIMLSRGDRLLFAVPILILTFADAIAALVGIAYGRVRYVTSDGLKSVEGSLAFFVIAFLSVHVPVLLFTDVGRLESLLIASIIGLLSTVIEAISSRGLDNLLIPLGAYGFLRLYLDATPEALALRLVITVSLVIFVFVWRHRTSMDDSALLAAALYGYGAGMLGGWQWLVGPVLLFLIHLWLWPRAAGRVVNTVWAVGSIVAPGLFWLVVNTADPSRTWLVPYAVTFAAHLAIIGVSRLACDCPRRFQMLCLAGAAAAGWLLFVLQVAPLLLRPLSPSAVPQPLVPWTLLAIAAASIAAVTLAFRLLMPRLYGPGGSRLMVHGAGFILAMSASAAAVVTVWGKPATIAPTSSGATDSTLR